VSAGAGNPYGHPARSTVDRLRDAGARVLRTDTDGSVTVTIDPDGTIAVATSGARRTSGAMGPDVPVVGPQLAAFGSGPPRLAPGPAAFACGIPSSG
jgi:competence protein ComEC